MGCSWMRSEGCVSVKSKERFLMYNKIKKIKSFECYDEFYHGERSIPREKWVLNPFIMVGDEIVTHANTNLLKIKHYFKLHTFKQQLITITIFKISINSCPSLLEDTHLHTTKIISKKHRFKMRKKVQCFNWVSILRQTLISRQKNIK